MTAYLMYDNKHPPPLTHTYTYQYSVLNSHTRKIHVRSKQTSLQFHPPDTTTCTKLQKTNTVHTVRCTKIHHNNRSQRLWSDYLQLAQTNKFQDPPPTPLKNFGTPHFLLYTPPPPLHHKF